MDRPAEFTVETKGAGAGGLSLAIEGPSEAKLTCKDHGDGTCSVKYTPVEPGDYEIHIKFADEHIPGSPFNAKVCQRKLPYFEFILLLTVIVQFCECTTKSVETVPND